MKTTLKYLKEFLRHPSRTGAVAASSRGLARLIVETAGVRDAGVIVEFGPGAGVFTERIRHEMPEGACFFAVEASEPFAREAARHCPDVPVYHDCATNSGRYLSAHGHDRCDCVVSGLPWAAFDGALQDRLIATILEILRPGGRFVTFAYVHGAFLPAGAAFRRKLQANFRRVEKTRTVWRNLPPAFVYSAER